jgi:hypothetical protein
VQQEDGRTGATEPLVTTFSVPKLAGNGWTAANADALTKKPTDTAAAKFRMV